MFVTRNPLLGGREKSQGQVDSNFRFNPVWGLLGMSLKPQTLHQSRPALQLQEMMGKGRGKNKGKSKSRRSDCALRFRQTRSAERTSEDTADQ